MKLSGRRQLIFYDCVAIVKRQHELEAINSVEKQTRSRDADNNKCSEHKEIDVRTTLASIAEEEQRRSAETTPNLHPKVKIIAPCDDINAKINGQSNYIGVIIAVMS